MGRSGTGDFFMFKFYPAFVKTLNTNEKKLCYPASILRSFRWLKGCIIFGMTIAMPLIFSVKKVKLDLSLLFLFSFLLIALISPPICFAQDENSDEDYSEQVDGLIGTRKKMSDASIVYAKLLLDRLNLLLTPQSVQLTDRQKAFAYDIFYGVSMEREFSRHFQKVPRPAILWVRTTRHSGNSFLARNVAQVLSPSPTSVASENLNAQLATIPWSSPTGILTKLDTNKNKTIIILDHFSAFHRNLHDSFNFRDLVEQGILRRTAAQLILIIDDENTWESLDESERLLVDFIVDGSSSIRSSCTARLQ